MKPVPKNSVTKEDEQAYQIQNSTTLLMKLPSLDTTTASSKGATFKGSTSTGIAQRKFTFTHIFRPETTQLELFEQAVKQQMIDFLDGQNSTIITYGTTDSGKSYTMQGTNTSPGILPRCLEFIFSNISTKSSPSYKPMHHSDVVCLGPSERDQELEIKTKLMTIASMDKRKYINAYTEMQKSLQEESPLTIRPSQCVDVHYSVWLSSAEIYNENVYDLFTNENQLKRTPLKVVADAKGTFIEDLKTISVNSGSEAFQILMAGKYNLKVAATALNARSSRSHCIFIIKLLKYYIENDTNTVKVSTFTFCDLAGSERLKKTLNTGDRLKEAQTINTSLLVLRRCLKAVRDGQSSKPKIENVVGPFRESKLTRLLQKAVTGKEHVALIVNINPLPKLYIETKDVLHFAAIAKDIVLEQKQEENKRKSRFSKMVTESIKTVTDWDAAELESEERHNTDDNHDMSDGQSNQALIVEKNKLTFEVDLIRKDSHNMKEVQKAVCTNKELQSQLFAQAETMKRLRVLLNEGKDEFISAKCTIKEQETELLKNQAAIDDLETDLTNLKICLMEKTEEVIVLEEKLENQNKQIKNLEKDLECKKKVLEQCYECPKDDTYQEIPPKAESEGLVLLRIEAETAEIGCQVNVESKEKQTWTSEEPEPEQTNENELHSKSSQTIESTTNEKSTQTSCYGEFVDPAPILNELAEIKMTCDDIKTHNKERCKQEALISRKKLENLTEESNTNKILVEKYEQSIELLNNDLSQSTGDKTHLKKLLKDSYELLHQCMEESIDTVTKLKQQIEELNKNLEMCQDEKEHLKKLLDDNNNKQTLQPRTSTERRLSPRNLPKAAGFYKN